MAFCSILFTFHPNIDTRFRFLMLVIVLFEDMFLTSGQEDLTIFANGDIRLNCSPTFEHPPGWQHLRDGNKNPFIVSMGDKLLDRYASNDRFSLVIDPQQRIYDLLIRNVVNGDAGIYTCNEDTDHRRIKLTVQKRTTKLLRSPTNTTVLIGKDAQLNCSTSFSAPVYWQHIPYHSQTLQGVYYGLHGLQGQYKTEGRYAVVVDESIGQYDLTIRNVQPSDAGKFTCSDNAGGGGKVSAELIVLGTIPSCVSNSTPEGAILANNTCGLDADFIKLTCSAIYFGHQPPTLKWFIGNISADEFPQTSSTHLHQATTEMIMEAKEWMQSTPICCRITESSWNNIQECSSLVKLNEFSHSREAVSISNIPSSSIKCDSGSTGRCVYEWKNEKGGIVMHGQILQPTHPNIVVPGQYTCFSTCDIGGVKCTKASAIVALPSTTVRESPRWIYAIIFGLLFVSIIIIAIIVYFIFTGKTHTCVWWLHKMLQRNDPNIQAGEKVHLNAVLSKSGVVQRNLIFFDKFGEDRNEHVRGIAVLNTNAYLIRNQSTRIEVYSFAFGEYSKIREIEVKGFSEVRYMAACCLNQRIYISDEDNFTIHTVQYKGEDGTPNESEYAVDSFHVDQEPEGLSVTHAGNIVITFQKVRQLGIYDMIGTHIRNIYLPDSISHPWYALEINSNEYLVSYDSEGESQITKVEVQSVGKYVPSNVSIIYKDPLWQGARSFARAEDGSIFLADFRQHTIFLLDANLKFVKIIASKLYGPTRLCYEKKDRHLYVTNHSTKDVYVFKYDAA